jgi:hypothetical protein
VTYGHVKMQKGEIGFDFNERFSHTRQVEREREREKEKERERERRWNGGNTQRGGAFRGKKVGTIFLARFFARAPTYKKRSR